MLRYKLYKLSPFSLTKRTVCKDFEENAVSRIWSIYNRNSTYILCKQHLNVSSQWVHTRRLIYHLLWHHKSHFKFPTLLIAYLQSQPNSILFGTDYNLFAWEHTYVMYCTAGETNIFLMVVFYTPGNERQHTLLFWTRKTVFLNFNTKTSKVVTHKMRCLFYCSTNSSISFEIRFRHNNRGCLEWIDCLTPFLN